MDETYYTCGLLAINSSYISQLLDLLALFAQLGPRKGNIFGSSANLVKSIIGSGVLGLPRAFSVSGWLLSLVVLAVSAVINALGLHYICKCVRATVTDRVCDAHGVKYPREPTACPQSYDSVCACTCTSAGASSRGALGTGPG